jgi:hypothetical protein
MLKEEFIKLTGFCPSETEYLEIDADYNKSDMDKKEFCENLLKNGYIRKASTRMAMEIAHLEDEVRSLKHIIAIKDNEQKKLKESLNDVRNMAINITRLTQVYE